MGKLDFAVNESPTLGVELELGIVDAESFALTNAFSDLVKRIPEEDQSLYQPELMQSVVEVITGVCDTVEDVERDLKGKLITLENAADELGLRLWWGSTHPFSSWLLQAKSPKTQ